MKENLIALATGLIFLAVGIICLFRPKKIQQYALDYYSKHRAFKKIIPFTGWLKTSSYILTLRMIGLMGIAGSILAFYALIRDL